MNLEATFRSQEQGSISWSLVIDRAKNHNFDYADLRCSGRAVVHSSVSIEYLFKSPKLDFYSHDTAEIEAEGRSSVHAGMQAIRMLRWKVRYLIGHSSGKI